MLRAASVRHMLLQAAPVRRVQSLPRQRVLRGTPVRRGVLGLSGILRPTRMLLDGGFMGRARELRRAKALLSARIRGRASSLRSATVLIRPRPLGSAAVLRRVRSLRSAAVLGGVRSLRSAAALRRLRPLRRELPGTVQDSVLPGAALRSVLPGTALNRALTCPAVCLMLAHGAVHLVLSCASAVSSVLSGSDALIHSAGSLCTRLTLADARTLAAAESRARRVRITAGLLVTRLLVARFVTSLRHAVRPRAGARTGAVDLPAGAAALQVNELT